MRALYRFGKKSRLRFVSHLDLQRYMQRTLNRSGLPIAYTQGFNPHPVMAFASALAMGWTSDYEVLDIRFAEAVSQAEALEKMAQAMPVDMPILEVRLVDDRHPALMALVTMSDYIITLEDENAEKVVAAIDAFAAADTVMATRKSKSGMKEFNARPLAVSLAGTGNEIRARLMLTETATLKPDILLGTLASLAGVETPPMRIHRLCLYGTNDGGEAIPLMEL